MGYRNHPFSNTNPFDQPPRADAYTSANEARLNAEKAERAKAMSKELGASAVLGSDVDENRANNIYAQKERSPEEQAKRAAYFEAEQVYEGIVGDGVYLGEAMARLQDRNANNGVTLNDDGTYTLKMDGESHHVTEQGVPVDGHTDPRQ